MADVSRVSRHTRARRRRISRQESRRPSICGGHQLDRAPAHQGPGVTSRRWASPRRTRRTLRPRDGPSRRDVRPRRHRVGIRPRTQGPPASRRKQRRWLEWTGGAERRSRMASRVALQARRASSVWAKSGVRAPCAILVSTNERVRWNRRWRQGRSSCVRAAASSPSRRRGSGAPLGARGRATLACDDNSATRPRGKHPRRRLQKRAERPSTAGDSSPSPRGFYSRCSRARRTRGATRRCTRRSARRTTTRNETSRCDSRDTSAARSSCTSTDSSPRARELVASRRPRVELIDLSRSTSVRGSCAAVSCVVPMKASASFAVDRRSCRARRALRVVAVPPPRSAFSSTVIERADAVARGSAIGAPGVARCRRTASASPPLDAAFGRPRRCAVALSGTVARTRRLTSREAIRPGRVSRSAAPSGGCTRLDRRSRRRSRSPRCRPFPRVAHHAAARARPCPRTATPRSRSDMVVAGHRTWSRSVVIAACDGRIACATERRPSAFAARGDAHSGALSVSGTFSIRRTAGRRAARGPRGWRPRLCTSRRRARRQNPALHRRSPRSRSRERRCGAAAARPRRGRAEAAAMRSHGVGGRRPCRPASALRIFLILSPRRDHVAASSCGDRRPARARWTSCRAWGASRRVDYSKAHSAKNLY